MASGHIEKTISECISQIHPDSCADYQVKEKALETLVSITKFASSPLNRNLVSLQNNIIPTILTLLKSMSFSSRNYNTEVEKLSLSILFNLSLNPNLKSTLAADMATIQHLNNIIILSSSAESSRLAASVICSLAMLDKNKAIFGVSNTIQALLKAVTISISKSKSKSKLDDVVAHLSSLAELAQFHGNCTLAVRADAVNVLLRIVEPQEEDCCGGGGEDSGTALVILGLLARFDEGLKAIIHTTPPSIVTRMLDVLKLGRRRRNDEGATEILIRVFDEISEECLKEAMPDLMFVLAEVSVRSGSTKAREKACLLLKKLDIISRDSDDNINLVFFKW